MKPFTFLLAILLAGLPVLAQEGHPVITLDNAAQVSQIAVLERGWINRIVWSADRSALAIATPAGLWFTDFAADPTLLPLDSEALSLASNADGTILAVGTTSGTVQLIDTSTGETLHTIQCADGWINEVAISPDGSLIACSSERALYKGVWSVTDNKELYAWSDSGPLALPDSNLLGSATTLLDLKTGDAVADIEDNYQDVVFGPHGSTITVLTTSGKIVTLDVATQEQRVLFEAQTSPFGQHLALSPDGQQLAVSMFNEAGSLTLVLMNRTTGNVDRVLESPYLAMQDIAYSPDGNQIAAATTAGHILVWNTSSGELAHDVAGFNEGGQWRGGASSDLSGVTCLAFSPDGMLAVGTGGYVITDGTIHLWNPATLKQDSAIPGEGTAWSLAYSPDGKRLAVSNSVDRLRIIDAHTGDVISAPDVPGDVMDLAFSPDGTQLALVYSDGSAQLLNVATGELGPSQANTSGETGLGVIAFSPDGKLVAFDNMLWNTTTGETRELEASGISSLAFSPDGKTLAAANESAIYLWDVASGDLKATYQGSRSVAFSPDGSILASGADEGAIILWDVTTGEQLAVLHGHTSTVHSLAFSPDGTLLASAAFDGTSRLWAVP